MSHKLSRKEKKQLFFSLYRDVVMVFGKMSDRSGDTFSSPKGGINFIYAMVPRYAEKGMNFGIKPENVVFPYV